MKLLQVPFHVQGVYHFQSIHLRVIIVCGLYTWFTRHNQMDTFSGTATKKLGPMSIPQSFFETNNNNQLAH
jgi:hypothetical protein